MEGGLTKQWLDDHRDLYHSATRHRFILSIRDGSVDRKHFKRWLGQDYVFVRSFIRFVANVLVKMPKDAPDTEIDTILGGISALEQEISWFRSEASEWEIDFGTVTLQEANKNYCRYLDDLSASTTHHAVALVAFWAIERVYNESFAICLEPGAKTQAEFRDACEMWGSEGFKVYCASLQRLVDKHLKGSPTDVQEQAERAFVTVLTREVEFWNMSTNES